MIRYSTGLKATGHGMTRNIKIEATADDDDIEVALRTVSAHTLGRIDGAGVVVIPIEEWQDRPCDPYDSIVEARWMMSCCGWQICGDTLEETSDA